MKRAMYVFSGDPITNGHIDVVERISSIFDEVIVGIGENLDKKYTFTLSERTEMAHKALDKFKNVKIVLFRGMLVRYAYENGVDVIVKGVRNQEDFNYENILQIVGESQKFDIETHVIFTRTDLAHVSSSVVKAIQKHQGLVHEYVPLYVKRKLESRISNQYILGITGTPASGKTYIGEKFVSRGHEIGFSCLIRLSLMACLANWTHGIKSIYKVSYK